MIARGEEGLRISEIVEALYRDAQTEFVPLDREGDRRAQG